MGEVSKQHRDLFALIDNLRDKIDAAAACKDQRTLLDLIEQLHAALRQLDALPPVRRLACEEN
jgi:hypothetical protein